ncbi:MAG: hypothetical protein IT292_12185 [Deltaproteobacteria bacterium]|nr:hypothetical protein [Deltaproteobacteria bacterium]
MTITSGKLIIIDQFMLSNKQFHAMIAPGYEEANIREAVKRYCGFYVELPLGEYSVYRDPYQMIIVLAPLENGEPDFSSIIDNHDELKASGKIFIDTRCVAFLDEDLLKDGVLLKEFTTLRLRGEDKQARDLIRNNGGAVRYGFSSVGDELTVHLSDDGKIVALWPQRS